MEYFNTGLLYLQIKFAFDVLHAFYISHLNARMYAAYALSFL